MSSLLSRFRASRAPSQSTIKSSDSNSTIEPVTPILSLASPTLSSSTSYDTDSIVNRQILSDISGLFNSRSEVDHCAEPSSTRGLRPPRSRGSTITKKSIREAEKPLGLNTLGTPQVSSWDDSSATEYRSPRQGLSPSKRPEPVEDISQNSPWSTFGRYNEQLTPPPPQSRTAGHSPCTSQPSENSNGHTPPAHRSSQSSRSSESPSNLSSNNTDTQSKSISSQSHVEHSIKLSSYANHSEHSSRASSIYATPATHIFVSESPRTFGHPSPSPLHARSRDRRRPSASPSPPPPLPPLNHPELILSLASRPLINSAICLDENRPQTGGWSAHLHTTFSPRRLRRKTEGDIRKTSSAAKSIFGRSINNLPSIPSAQRISRESTETPSQVITRSETSSRTRLRSKSDPMARRSSAYWCAQQATEGVNANIPGLYGWPAEVSREILKLSFGEDLLTKDARPRSPERPATSVQHGGNVPAGLIRDSLKRGGPLCLQSSLIPPSPPLATLQSPILLQETEFDCGGKLSSRSSSSDTLGQIQAEHSDPGDCMMVQEAITINTLNGNADKDTNAPKHKLNGNGNVKSKPRTSDRHRHRPSRHSILKPVGFPSTIQEAGSSVEVSSFPSSDPASNDSQTAKSERRRSASEPAIQAVLQTPVNKKKGKRKAEDVDVTPPDAKNGQHATFLLPESRRPHLPSEISNAPSSYGRKRVRLSDAALSTPTPSPGHSRPSTGQDSIASSPGTWPSRTGAQLARVGSKTASMRSLHRSVLTADASAAASLDRRRSMSEVSIPISALVAPHAPSISKSSTYHMRDPRRPPKVTPTEWSLSLRNPDKEGSPVHAWCFFVGFVLFPMWWAASFAPIPKTRRVGGTDTEKAVTLDDPQVEHDARSWRNRCRVMTVISLFTYVPFIVLIAVFAPR